jgi:hypothetical protein
MHLVSGRQGHFKMEHALKITKHQTKSQSEKNIKSKKVKKFKWSIGEIQSLKLHGPGVRLITKTYLRVDYSHR